MTVAYYGVTALLELDRAALGKQRSDLAQRVVGRLVLEREHVHQDRLLVGRYCGRRGLGRGGAFGAQRLQEHRPQTERTGRSHPSTDLPPRHVHVGEDDQRQVALVDLGRDVGVGDGLDRGQVLGRGNRPGETRR